jgi:hypothetical protein
MEPQLTLADCEAKLRTSREQLADLITKRGKIDEEGVILVEQRETLAFDAHCGNATARRKLDNLNQQLSKLRLDEESLQSAIATAHLRVSEAEQALRQAQSAANASAAQALCPLLLEHGVAADAAVAELTEALDGIRDTIRQLRQLGVHAVNERSMALALKQALENALIVEGLDVPLHPPHQRRGFGQLVTVWLRNVASRQNEQEAA